MLIIAAVAGCVAVVTIVAVLALSGGSGSSPLGGKDDSLSNLSKSELKALLPTDSELPDGYENLSKDDTSTPSTPSTTMRAPSVTYSPDSCKPQRSNSTDRVSMLIAKQGDARTHIDTFTGVAIAKDGPEFIEQMSDRVSECAEYSWQSESSKFTCKLRKIDVPSTAAKQVLGVQEDCKVSGRTLTSVDYYAQLRGLRVSVTGKEKSQDAAEELFKIAVQKVADHP